jgi:hypothetical protein
VQLEKVMVPHWVRGEGRRRSLQFPSQAENTTQKVVLAHSAKVWPRRPRITAEVVVVRNFDELKH